MRQFKIVLILFLLGCISNLRGQEKVFMAGASQIDITPPLGLELIGNFAENFAGNIHDPLHAKSLVLDDGNSKIAIVIVDNLGVTEKVFEQAKEYIQNEIGLKKDHVLIASTHTHSGPDAGEFYMSETEPLTEYGKFLARKIADGVTTSHHNLEPAKIAWGGVAVPEHVFVRRWFMKDSVYSPYGTKDIVAMNPGTMNPNIVKPSGPVDPEVSFISLQATSGRPISVLANYSLHYVGWVPKGDISADYFALFGAYLGQKLSVDEDMKYPPFVGIMSNGTSGNVNNNDYGKPRGETRSVDRPYEQMDYVARDVAEKVYKALQKVKYSSWVPLGGELSVLPLKTHRASPEVMANVARILDRPDSDKPLYSSREKIYAKRILKMELEWPDEIEVQLQALRIGDLGITGLPFEAFTQIGLEIKDKSPFKDTFTIELANGDYLYLPTPQEVELGGYETWLSIRTVEKYASDKITKRLLEQLNSLK
ncbi:neutral/alkaline non-lysosomal ceramidase N-terminal domain-containing protein [Kriegella aquimaris]|uniref:Neutral/alkaline non-lysosomal ceramidase, N-terminal n=1 Tax=Kriegella aquimaris TaxID=192904 RepID=A0A1G9VGT3_9FLAO|nr:neutral/alkaline non-lysosomal ceramidase N-terminal domain-containing protein [Kriegella aquimaris]SDM71414.1 Neutral/alkaline non-lysosomal ceramidase, N-terminal [Kriegella aquimaris]